MTDRKHNNCGSSLIKATALLFATGTAIYLLLESEDAAGSSQGVTLWDRPRALSTIDELPAGGDASCLDTPIHGWPTKLQEISELMGVGDCPGGVTFLAGYGVTCDTDLRTDSRVKAMLPFMGPSWPQTIGSLCPVTCGRPCARRKQAHVPYLPPALPTTCPEGWVPTFGDSLNGECLGLGIELRTDMHRHTHTQGESPLGAFSNIGECADACEAEENCVAFDYTAFKGWHNKGLCFSNVRCSQQDLNDGNLSCKRSTLTVFLPTGTGECRDRSSEDVALYPAWGWYTDDDVQAACEAESTCVAFWRHSAEKGHKVFCSTVNSFCTKEGNGGRASLPRTSGALTQRGDGTPSLATALSGSGQVNAEMCFVKVSTVPAEVDFTSLPALLPAGWPDLRKAETDTLLVLPSTSLPSSTAIPEATRRTRQRIAVVISVVFGALGLGTWAWLASIKHGAHAWLRARVPSCFRCCVQKRPTPDFIARVSVFRMALLLLAGADFCTDMFALAELDAVHFPYGVACLAFGVGVNALAMVGGFFRVARRRDLLDGEQVEAYTHLHNAITIIGATDLSSLSLLAWKDGRFAGFPTKALSQLALLSVFTENVPQIAVQSSNAVATRQLTYIQLASIAISSIAVLMRVVNVAFLTCLQGLKDWQKPTGAAGWFWGPAEASPTAAGPKVAQAEATAPGPKTVEGPAAVEAESAIVHEYCV